MIKEEKLQKRAAARAARLAKKNARIAARLSRKQNRSGVPVTAGPQYAVSPQGIPMSTVLPGQPSCSGACFPNVGWLGPALTFMANNRKFAMSAHPDNQVLLPDTQPLTLAYGTPAELARACAIAVQGVGNLKFAQALWAAADLTLSLAGTTVFGFLVRITNSFLNFKFGVYEATFRNNAVVQSKVLFKVTKIPAEFLVLSISNNNGMASVVPATIPDVQFLLAENAALVNASDVLYAESLNMKDLGDVTIV